MITDGLAAVFCSAVVCCSSAVAAGTPIRAMLLSVTAAVSSATELWLNSLLKLVLGFASNRPYSADNRDYSGTDSYADQRRSFARHGGWREPVRPQWHCFHPPSYPTPGDCPPSVYWALTTLGPVSATWSAVSTLATSPCLSKVTRAHRALAQLIRCQPSLDCHRGIRNPRQWLSKSRCADRRAVRIGQSQHVRRPRGATKSAPDWAVSCGKVVGQACGVDAHGRGLVRDRLGGHRVQKNRWCSRPNRRPWC